MVQKTKSITGHSFTSYKELGNLIKICGKSGVENLTLPDGISVMFKGEPVEDEIKPIRQSDSAGTFQLGMFDTASDIDIEDSNAMIDGEDCKTAITDVVENTEAELDTLMVTNPAEYEDIILAEMRNNERT